MPYLVENTISIVRDVDHEKYLKRRRLIDTKRIMGNLRSIRPAEAYLKLLLGKGAKVPAEDVELTPGNSHSAISLPPWYDEELFRRAQHYYRVNIFVIFKSMLCGLILVLSVPSILRILCRTKRSGCPTTAYHRYVKTIFHVLLWNFVPLKPGSLSWKSLESVRRGHRFASKMSYKREGFFISQADMALTQFGFMGFSTLKAEDLGINTSDEYFEATVHFWRVIGHVLGIKEEFNLCAESWSVTKPRLELVLDRVYRPSLQDNSPDFVFMAKQLISGVSYFHPLIRYHSFLYFAKHLAGCSGFEYHKKDQTDKFHQLPIFDRLAVFAFLSLHSKMFRFYLLRLHFNFQIYLLIFLAHFLPIFAIPLGFRRVFLRF